MWFNRKKIKIAEVSKFSIWSYKQNRKLENLLSFALNSDCFDSIKCRKAEKFH